MRSGRVLLLSIAAAAAGCSGNQSALDARGAPALQVEHLIVGMMVVCGVIWALVMIVLLLALLRTRGGGKSHQRTPNARLQKTVTAAVAATAVIVAALTVASFYTTRSLGASDKAALTITVKGQQWWWHISYENADPAFAFQTANEIHIPVGRDVHLRLETPDVIHSFWVPSLAGKQDLVPGRLNDLVLRADKPGIYRGQCAEYCGLQHSHMAVLVIAEAEPDYDRWAALQRSEAAPPRSPDVAAGKAAFLAKPCAACHTVRGTSAKGTTGPDLTHIGGRQTIAAGLLDRTRGSLAAWIADPQTLKPGNNMPLVVLTSDELRDISAYMESLK